MQRETLRSALALSLAASLAATTSALSACSSNENGAQRSLGAPAPAPTASAASGVGGPCFVSMVRTVDGKPSAEQRCETGLVCDYDGAVPDGPGRCRR